MGFVTLIQETHDRDQAFDIMIKKFYINILVILNLNKNKTH